MRFKTALLPLTMPLLLAACGGGGDGGNNDPLTLDSTPSEFTSFSDITANSLVEAWANRSVNYAADVENGDVQRDGTMTTTGYTDVRLLTGDAINPTDPSLGFEFGGLRLTVDVPGVPVETIVRDFMEEGTEAGVGGVVAERFAEFAIENDVNEVTDRLYLEADDGLNYMTFGIWELDLTETTRDIGGAAWGAMTPLDGNDTMSTPVNTATYTGDLIGYNVVETETDIFIATSTIVADFDQEEVTFSSVDTVRLADGDPRSGFDIAATTGNIDGNSFSGLNPQLGNNLPNTFEGSFGGNFYGPDAAEAGGWFQIRTVANSDRYFGSFGGVQP